jgi:hypothetical protein
MLSLPSNSQLTAAPSFLELVQRKLHRDTSILDSIPLVPYPFGNAAEPTFRNPKEEIDALIHPCRAEIQGIGLGQVVCLWQVQKALLNEARVYLAGIEVWVGAQKQMIAPGVIVRTEAGESLRATQVALLDTTTSFAASVKRTLDQWANLLNVQWEFVSGYAKLEAEARNTLDEEGQAEWRQSVDPIYFDFVRRVQLPLLDIGLSELKILRSTAPIVARGHATTAQTARDLLIGWTQTSETWNATLSRQGPQKGILQRALEALLGEKPTERIAVGLLTIGAAFVGLVGLLWGGSYLLRRAREEWD